MRLLVSINFTKLKKNMEHFTVSDNLYRCKHCKKVVLRNSVKSWIPSYCEQTGKNVRLVMVKYYHLKEGETIQEGE